MVYKLVNLHGVPRIKLSDEREKTTIPGPKSIVRVYTEKGTKPAFDIICLYCEAENF